MIYSEGENFYVKSTVNLPQVSDSPTGTHAVTIDTNHIGKRKYVS